MKAWHDLLRKTLEQGASRPDRTGVGTLALFGEQFEVFNTGGYFPAVTTKRLGFDQVKAELACFIHGYDSLADFHKMGCKIWDANGMADYWVHKAAFPGDLGRIYGVQWRDWISVSRHNTQMHTDQLAKLIDGIRSDPNGRRHVVTAFNPGELDDVCLPPCHVLFQVFVAYGQLDLRVDMRSVDLFLGLPFDIASYAILQRLIAKETGYESGRLVFQLGDAHVYKNHLDAVMEVLARDVRQGPQLQLSPDASLFSFGPQDVTMINYVSHPPVRALMNV